MPVHGKTVIITGASRGIGEATAEAFAAAGAKVVLASRGRSAIQEIADSIGENALAVPCDVGCYGDVSDMVAAAESAFGSVDILINNAGVIEPISHLVTSDPDSWGGTVDINLKGVYHGMRAVLPGMIERGVGTILTVSSGAAHSPVEAWSHYCAAKAGAAMLTRSADKEAREAGVRVMSLSPGTVATKMQREIKASGINPVSKLALSDHIPADWPARALLWMCGPEANAFVGEEISLRDEKILKSVGLVP